MKFLRKLRQRVEPDCQPKVKSGSHAKDIFHRLVNKVKNKCRLKTLESNVKEIYHSDISHTTAPSSKAQSHNNLPEPIVLSEQTSDSHSIASFREVAEIALDYVYTTGQECHETNTYDTNTSGAQGDDVHEAHAVKQTQIDYDNTDTTSCDLLQPSIYHFKTEAGHVDRPQSSFVFTDRNGANNGSSNTATLTYLAPKVDGDMSMVTYNDNSRQHQLAFFLARKYQAFSSVLYMKQMDVVLARTLLPDLITNINPYAVLTNALMETLNSHFRDKSRPEMKRWWLKSDTSGELGSQMVDVGSGRLVRRSRRLAPIGVKKIS